MVDRVCADHNIGLGKDISLEHGICSHSNRASDNPDDVLRKRTASEGNLYGGRLDESS